VKRLLPAVLLVFCCLLAPPVPAASAPDSLEVLSSTVEAQFPLRLVFSVEAESASTITDVRLLYQVDKMNYAQVISEAWPPFEASTRVSTSWTWDMRRASLPPGADVTYWWKLRDSSGAVIETSPKLVSFDDDRFEWSALESPDVTILWYSGDEAFADELLDVCEAAIEMLAVDVGTRVDRHIDIYIYASSTDLRQAMVYPQEWTGGVAFTEYGTIAIGIGPGDMDWGMRALRHELTHLVVHTAVFSPFGRLPTWLDEGLAMHNEGEASESFESLLYAAAGQDALLSLRTLSGPFSSDTAKAYLSYAESHSVVQYLLEEYGSTAMHDLLMSMKDGETVDDALMMSFGLDIDGVEAAWRASIMEELARA
jgi:hypothetical protein